MELHSFTDNHIHTLHTYLMYLPCIRTLRTYLANMTLPLLCSTGTIILNYYYAVVYKRLYFYIIVTFLLVLIC